MVWCRENKNGRTTEDPRYNDTVHRRRKRFRILWGARFIILGGQGGPNSQQAHDVVT